MIALPRTSVIHYERIDSTNAEARRLAGKGERGPLWLIAGEQTAGRGRLGRTWVSEPGNLYATLLLPLECGVAAAAQLGFVAALAVHDVVSAIARTTNVGIKWPNDVLVGGAKICGLLAEVVSTEPTQVAIGCGLNVGHAPAGTPYPVTALARCADAPPLAVIFQRLDTQLGLRLREWDAGRGFSSIRKNWSARAIGYGGAVKVASGGRELTGRFVDLAEDGALLLATAAGERIPIHAGDVRFAELEHMRQNTP